MTRRKRPDLPLLAEHLKRLRGEWDGLRLDSDPLSFPHRYAQAADREVIAFLSASLAFGRVASICASLEEVARVLGPEPVHALRTRSWDEARLSRFVHRWVRGEDLRAVFVALSVALERHGSLGALFAEGDAGGHDFVGALDAFYSRLREPAGDEPIRRGVRFLLPAPGDGSAAKRAHLFLRWMVRTSAFDLGLWRGGLFTPARLLLPLDTHVHRIATYLGLTHRRTADLAASREATSWLRRVDPDDPVSFDWALSRLGILAECLRDERRRRCDRCAVRPVCRVARPGSATLPTPEVTACR